MSIPLLVDFSMYATPQGDSGDGTTNFVNTGSTSEIKWDRSVI